MRSSLPPTIHLSISGSVLAFYGAILSTITAAAQILSYLRDKTKIRIRAEWGMAIAGDPRYSGMTLVIMTVTNVGRRPVTITTVGVKCLYPHQHFVFTDARPSLPCELTEGNHLTVIVDQEGFDPHVVNYWEAWDAAGRRYKLRSAPWKKSWESALKRRFGRYKNAAETGAGA